MLCIKYPKTPAMHVYQKSCKLRIKVRGKLLESMKHKHVAIDGVSLAAERKTESNPLHRLGRETEVAVEVKPVEDLTRCRDAVTHRILAPRWCLAPPSHPSRLTTAADTGGAILSSGV